MELNNALVTAWTKGKQAAWQVRWPGIALWLFGVVVIGGYFWIEPFRNALETIGEYKTKYGILFGIVSTAIFGGLLPSLMQRMTDQRPNKVFAAILIGNVVFWAFKGAEIDLLYRFQAWLFGNDASAATIAKKVALDMTLYAPLCGLLNCVLFYIWQDNGYSITRTRQSLGPKWYARKVMPALISNWCVWLPAAIVIYALPLALQLPVQNLILCFWVLVLVFFTTEEIDQKKKATAQG